MSFTRLSGLFVAVALLAFPSCVSTPIPIPAIEVAQTPDERADTLIVFLPGLSDEGQDFIEHGFSQILEASGIEADMVFLDAHFGYYKKRLTGALVHEHVIAPAKARGQSVYIVGISMGGLGALLSARASSGAIDGLVLLSPYLGKTKVLEEIGEAGGLRAWEPGPKQNDWTTELWLWLKASEGQFPIFVGWGEGEDSASFELLAEFAGAERSFRVPGAHKWTTWEVLWPMMLEAGPFGG